MALNDGHSSLLLSKVSALFKKKVPAEQVEIVEQFACNLYGNMSSDDLSQRNDSDLYGAALSLWHQLNDFKGDEPLIRVYNPELSKHGWESRHTIVEIIVKDLPFLVDSVRMALNRNGMASHLLLHSPMGLVRDKKNQVTDIKSADAKDISEHATVFLIEIDRQTEASVMTALKEELLSVLDDVALSVADWQPLQDKLQSVIKDLSKRNVPKVNDQLKEGKAFLEWLADHNFTFMGYRSYTLDAVKGDYVLTPEDDTSLGLMRKSVGKDALELSSLPESARAEALGEKLLILTKTNSKSRVHRPANIDYVGVKRFDKNGKVVGEDRFIGLFASSFYNSSATNIPFLRAKLDRVMAGTEFAVGSHAYKAVLNILETYPRDELIQASESELRDVATGVLQMQERDMSRLFVRRDIFGRFVTGMVYVPRERYNTALRIETQRILRQAYSSDKEVEFTTFFSESVLARTHYIVHVDGKKLDIDVKAIEQNLIEAARTWEDKLETALISRKGESKGKALTRKFGHSFSPSYKEEVFPSAAVVDIEQLEALDEDNKLGMLFYRPQEEQSDSKLVKLKLFHKDEPIHLSDVLPMLENFGLRVIGERPYKVTRSDGQVFWILDFSMILNSEIGLDLEKSQSMFQEAFAKVWASELEDDGFNRLILGAGISGREVSILRAYAKYMRQIGGAFSQNYVESTFSNYADIAQLLISLFNKKFSPKLKRNEKAVEKLTGQITEALDNVASLDDDRIIRQYVEMINATLRTNYFQKDDAGNDKPYISFKIQPELISEIPLPIPKFEIFVYSPKVEGVHLRGGKVARGGLRWSDRLEDFRTEVLGLVKAQQVKNTVIVPVGSKGGFVCKQLSNDMDRQTFFEEGQNCYKTFIRGLLDITDNIVHGDVVPPVDVVRLDEDDPYLVVAADKGTATFSDLANEIAESYNFWLGDAFASGGSIGYDHKKMGITARGAWESVKRHFREMGIDCQSTDFTAMGVGDMGGDVFGNGMLLSKHTRLQAAFNHMHIFIDPNPDAAKSYKERDRLFKLPRSSWEDYNKDLISEGGGVFLRSAKSIKLTPQIKKMVGTQKNTMAPNDLIRAILKMDVDLMWNGGIGTYVKGTSETDADVGDRANDALRINGNELKAKIVGEGGNLGLTQLGRIEYAEQGGRICTDFVDNVGGVACSDNEVNIKILLNGLVDEGELTVKQRNELLYDMTDTVSDMVLADCYRQTHSLSITQLRSSEQLKEHIRLLHALERDGKLNRELEYLPSDDDLAERGAAGYGLTRPELSVLLAYAKMVMKEELVIPEITDKGFYQQWLINAFPQVLQDRFSTHMPNHPLKGEIIATKLANMLINEMGLNFMHRMREETGASIADITDSYVVARELFNLPGLWQSIEGLDNKIPAVVQTEMLFQLRRNVRRATRWFLRHRDKSLSIEEQIAFYQPTFSDLAQNMYSYLVDDESEQLKHVEQDLKREGVPGELAKGISQLSTLFSALDLAQVAHTEKRPVSMVSELYFKLGSRLDLHWFLDQITHQPVANHWQALARASFREELDWQQRSLAAVALRYCGEEVCEADAMVEQWVDAHKELLERWQHVLSDFRTSQSHEFAKFSVALRELMLLSHNCVPAQ